MQLQFTFASILPANWLKPAPLISGEYSKSYGLEEYMLVWEGEECVAAYTLRYEAHVGPFKQACSLDGVIGVGHEEHFYMYDTISKTTLLQLRMEGYFGHLYLSEGKFFVADSQGIRCITPSGEQIWKNCKLGIDGVVITRFESTKIWGEGEWDPPGGWRSFVLESRTGELLS